MAYSYVRLDAGGMIHYKAEWGWETCHDAEIRGIHLLNNKPPVATEHQDLVIVRIVGIKVVSMYFSEDQIKDNFVDRLAYWQGCYGSIVPRNMKGRSLR